MSREFAPAAGNGPVWIVGLGGPSGFLTRHAALWYYSQSPIDFEVGFGYGHKAFFAVRPGYRQTVTIRGGNLRNGQPMHWPTLNDLDPAHPTRTRILVLTPQPGQAHSAWAQYRDGLYVPQAGCYYLEARYPGGGWRITFGAGR